MAFIRVSIEDLRKAAKGLAEVAERANTIISQLHSASTVASFAEGDFGSRVKQREALAVPFIQRIINDAASAGEYLMQKANAFEQADLAAQDGLLRIAEQIRVLADFEVSFPLMPPWLWNGKCPPGFNAEIWRRLPLEDREEILSDPLRQWDQWIRQKIASGEIDQATIEEFEDLIAGVRKVWAWGSLNVRAAPGIGSDQLGSLVSGQIVNWTGNVRSVNGDEWYEVIYEDRYGREVHGWAWTGRLEQYVYVNPERDPNRGGSHPFDMSEPGAYFPQDDEIEMAVEATRKPQRIRLADFLRKYTDSNGRPLVPKEENNNEMCGQFVIAAALEEDVLDVLDAWMEHDRINAERILVNDEATTRVQLQGILDAYRRTYENHDGWMSPAAMQRELESGRQFVALVGVERWQSQEGRLIAGGAGHWALVEDVVPAGNSGWVRVWHSYITNDKNLIDQGEPIIYGQVYTFEELLAAWGEPGEGNSSRYSGFWIEPEHSDSGRPFNEN